MEGSLSDCCRDIRFSFRSKRFEDREAANCARDKAEIFRNNSYEVDEVCRAQLEFSDNEVCVVEKIIDIRLHKGERRLLVKWIGFKNEEHGWENLSKICEDVPVLVQELLSDVKSTGTTQQKRLASSV